MDTDASPPIIPLENLPEALLSLLPTLNQEHGYKYFCMPGHPLANKSGKVYVSCLIMSVKLARWVHPNEIVKYVDGDPDNLSPENLVVTNRAQHARETLHGGPSQKVKLICQRTGCNTVFYESPSHVERRKYCSETSTHLARQKFSILPEELAALVWELPMTQIAKEYGISDRAVKKRCRKHGIETPGRGYWAKLQAGQLDPEVVKEIEQLKQQAQLALERLGQEFGETNHDIHP